MGKKKPASEKKSEKPHKFDPALLASTAEYKRLNETFSGPVQPWRKWGCYVSERQWGTVREDKSPDGTAWDYFPHDQARSRAYRWGEDAIAGICDRYQILTFGLALWNGRDPILKERMFGLGNSEGNHGEDVKEYWFYQDNTPTHSYMRMLYKYPQLEFPYNDLVQENGRRHGQDSEYELLDTGIFNQDKYFDVSIEYAKAAPEDICIRIEAFNRGPEPAELHLIPQFWFRNTWSWDAERGAEPIIRMADDQSGALLADDSSAAPPPNLHFDYHLGRMFLYGPSNGRALFTGNETNWARLRNEQQLPTSRFTKDAFHRHIIQGEDSTNSLLSGTKACLHYLQVVPPGGSWILQLRLTNARLEKPLEEVDAICNLRREESDIFYDAIARPNASAEDKVIQRAALAGMLWNKHVYLFDVERWLQENHAGEGAGAGRNAHWRHLNSMRVLAVPDKWEFPWFAAWDLAFQCITIALVDLEFAKENLWLLLFEQFQHPSGQIPAYEWEFSDVNPPVHAFACWRVYQTEKERFGTADRNFLEKCFHKLLINFAWWVNRVDGEGNNVFEGGFLGLDNITILDRSYGLPGGTVLEQSDATGWMAFFCLNLMKIALELAKENSAYEVLATKFFEHFIYIGSAMKRMGGRNYQLWDEEEGFFFDVLRYPNGHFEKFRVRSVVGIIPLFAVEVLSADEIKDHSVFLSNVEWFLNNRRDLVGDTCWISEQAGEKRYVLSLVDRQQFGRVLQRLADPEEFLSPVGLRSLSKFHLKNEYSFGDVKLGYAPAESREGTKGGNSNWRGPVWFPTSYMLIQALTCFADALGSGFQTTGKDGIAIAPRVFAEELANRLISIFKRDHRGWRPCYGGTLKFQEDPHWRDHLLFNEYFHGDDGAGLGASHQTGWTGLVANLIDEWR